MTFLLTFPARCQYVQYELGNSQGNLWNNVVREMYSTVQNTGHKSHFQDTNQVLTYHRDLCLPNRYNRVAGAAI
jgi:urease beta subunit